MDAEQIKWKNNNNLNITIGTIVLLEDYSNYKLDYNVKYQMLCCEWYCAAEVF